MERKDRLTISENKVYTKSEKTLYFSEIMNWIYKRSLYIAISLIITFVAALLYIKLSVPIFKVSTTILIDEEKRRISTEPDQVLEGFGLSAGMKNIDNQMLLLTSRSLVGKTVDELDLFLEYYESKGLRKVILFPETPIRIITLENSDLPSDIVFKTHLIDSNKIRIRSLTNNSTKLDTTVYFGGKFFMNSDTFRFELANKEWPLGDLSDRIYFIKHSRKKLIDSYIKRLKVEQISYKGTLIRISLEGTNTENDILFLKKLTEIFLQNSLDKKNEEATKTIHFIDEQLIGISDSLLITENKLQHFRSKNRIMDLSAQGQVIIDQAMSLENEKARIEIESNYYSYLVDYLKKDNIGEVPIAPATMGITDPGLTKLVTDLADLQGQLYSKSLGAKNPLQSQILQRVRTTKEALQETLNGVIRANNLARNENLAQIRTVNAQATALPVTERELLGIERKFKLNDELYTFLLEKRSIAQIQKASNIPDNEIVDQAEADNKPIKPNKTLIFLIALVMGIGIPVSIMLILEAFNNKIRNEGDILQLGDLFLCGNIPHCHGNSNVNLNNNINSLVIESFRSIRNLFQTLNKDIKSPIIVVTSSTSKEGKTFIASNLAVLYGMTGSKTVLVDMDLRNPHIHNNFNIKNDFGIDNWLLGQKELDEVIRPTSINNLFIIPGQKIISNPSEMMNFVKVTSLFEILKKDFDNIVVDTSPFGSVTDAFNLISLADICLVVTRQGFSTKEMLQETINKIDNTENKLISIVLNDKYLSPQKYSYHF